MKSKIIIKTPSLEVDITPIAFSGGELNVQVPTELCVHNDVDVIASISDAAGIIALAMVKDAIERITDADIYLHLGYVPYARQDRVCNVGEALSIKVMCDIINAMKFTSVGILDPHSDVTPALLDNVYIVPPTVPLAHSSLYEDLIAKKYTLVAPDAGATKKVEKVSQFFGGLEIIQGMKKRDLATGKLSGFTFYGDVRDKDLLIVDDICDFGGTFIGLAGKLKEGGAKSISLYVSHGILAGGIERLLDGGIDKVYTTDSFNNGIEHKQLEVIPWI